MRLLFLAPNLAAGGQERQLSILLPGLRERGFDARLIALDGGGPFEQPLREAMVPLEVLDMRHQADLGPLVRSPILRRFAPQAIVSYAPSALYVGTALARWRGSLNTYNEHRQVGLELSRRRETMVRLIMRRLDLVIAVSEEQSEVWRRRGYPAERIEVVANGVPGHPVTDARAEVRRELGIPDSAVVALLAARLRPEKRVGDFVAAVARARESLPDLVGVIAGEGPDLAAVTAAAEGRDGVHVLGHRDDVRRLFEAADIFVLASEYEALPMAILEAMAAGLPVVSTAVGSIPGVVEDGRTGSLVPPGDPAALAAGLVALAQDPELRASMGRQARQRHAERFSAATMIDRYAELLQTRWDADRAGARSASSRPLRSVPGRTNRKL